MPAARDTDLAHEAAFAARRLAHLAQQSRIAEQPAARYLGEDRATRGDWYTYYGSEAFVLCAQQAPADLSGTYVTGWQVTPRPGNVKEQSRYWVTGPRDDHPSMLYNPAQRLRRAANWDDRGEAYPRSAGPDLWLDVALPAGEHRLSLYFVNDHSYYEPRRAYTISVFDAQGRYQAGAEVRHFLNGVYQQFSVTGPGKLRVCIGRDLSMNALLAGVFLDPLAPPVVAAPPAGLNLPVAAWTAWEAEHARHLSSADEGAAFREAFPATRRRTDGQLTALREFLVRLSEQELGARQYGLAMWASEAATALPYPDRAARLKALRETIHRFCRPLCRRRSSALKTGQPSVCPAAQSGGSRDTGGGAAMPSSPRMGAAEGSHG